MKEHPTICRWQPDCHAGADCAAIGGADAHLGLKVGGGGDTQVMISLFLRMVEGRGLSRLGQWWSWVATTLKPDSAGISKSSNDAISAGNQWILPQQRNYKIDGANAVAPAMMPKIRADVSSTTGWFDEGDLPCCCCWYAVECCGFPISHIRAVKKRQKGAEITKKGGRLKYYITPLPNRFQIPLLFSKICCWDYHCIR